LAYEVIYYLTSRNRCPAQEWLDTIKDKTALATINVCIRRASTGYFGRHRYLGDDVFELKVNYGPGFRVYCSVQKQRLLIILMGGDKGSQMMDIQKAKLNLRKWKALHNEK
jgi:putative addiction module killer protein